MKLYIHQLNLPRLLWSLVFQANKRNKKLKKKKKATTNQQKTLYLTYPYIISLIKHRASLPQKTLGFLSSLLL